MLIGLISDTHIREPVPALPPEISEAFAGVDLILHGGDIYIPSVLDELEYIAPVLAVIGDDDYGEILKDKRVKQKYELCLEGHSLWLIHYNPFRYSLGTEQSIKKEEMSSDYPEIVVFGHTHYSTVKQQNGISLINPGSPFNYTHKLGTVATLRLEPGKMKVNLLDLEKLDF